MDLFHTFNTSRLERNGRRFVHISRRISLNNNVCILIKKIQLKFVPKYPVNNWQVNIGSGNGVGPNITWTTDDPAFGAYIMT